MEVYWNTRKLSHERNVTGNLENHWDLTVYQDCYQILDCSWNVTILAEFQNITSFLEFNSGSRMTLKSKSFSKFWNFT